MDPERDLLEDAPDYLLVMPWHFRPFFEANPNLDSANLVFPLPELSVRAAR
jgi:NDP-4-keto-2,6-dideoxyhexose 3-C-methyltransferase